MSTFRWTREHLRQAEEALERHRRLIEAGEREVGIVRAEPACERQCSTCDLRCAVIVSCVETTRRGLAEQERAEVPAWELRHEGTSYAIVAGRA